MELSSIIKDDMKKVPRPLNCFMTYRLEKQREILEQCPGANHRDISKITAKWWKNMSIAEKEPYRIKAEQAKNEHEKLYPDYKFKPKKKLVKTRVYKKRSASEYTSEDLKQKQQLAILYYQGIPSSGASWNNNAMMPSTKTDCRPYTSTSTQYHSYNLDTSSKSAEANMKTANYESQSSPSSSSLDEPMPQRYSSVPAKRTDARLSPFSILSHSISLSPPPSVLNSHRSSNSLDHFSALGKVGSKFCNDVLNSSNRFYGSANLLQEPPSDPFDSPYNSNNRILSNGGFESYSQHNGSSSILSLSHHFKQYPKFRENATDFYKMEHEERNDSHSGHRSIGSNGMKFSNLFHPGTNLKSTHSHISLYHPPANF